MKISKSKQELARIISENGGWREGEFAAQNGEHGRINFSQNKPVRHDARSWMVNGGFQFKIEVCKPLPNWHQTTLSRTEFFHLYPAPDADGWIEWNGGECPVDGDCEVSIRVRGEGGSARGKAKHWSWGHSGCGSDIIAYRLHKPGLAYPTPETKPTIEQLAADYLNAKDYAERKQQEADAAKADAGAKLKALELAGEALGLSVSPITAKKGPELVITDWRDLQVGDEVEVIESMSGNRSGEIGVVSRFDKSDKGREVRVIFGGCKGDFEWLKKWRFIRRP